MMAANVEHELRTLVGEAYPTLDELSRMILFMAHRFGEVRNQDLQPHRKEHPREIGERLGQLTASGWLSKEGHGKGTLYRWPIQIHADLLAAPENAAGVVTGVVTREIKLLLCSLQGEMSRTQLQANLGLVHEDHFRNAYLMPALHAGLIEMTIPNKPTSRLQRYQLTQRGQIMQDTLRDETP